MFTYIKGIVPEIIIYINLHILDRSQTCGKVNLFNQKQVLLPFNCSLINKLQDAQAEKLTSLQANKLTSW